MTVAEAADVMEKSIKWSLLCAAMKILANAATAQNAASFFVPLTLLAGL